ncbi:TonB-dependent receptor [Salegentibacter sp. 24]|uniref:TonB-dependent receptor n=1 Tax=Salegentibacter sp. 24 TaxID=2183986 RepID=UPI00105BB8D3|nr:TonB-dependent receptor [Salegentibacter sp. 24]TDN95248.1 TonB-dependent receptor [Salegentibacter sp. 24]
MKNYLSILTLLFLSMVMQSQEETTGTIAGKLSDNEVEGQPLPFANVIIKEINKGTTTDFDGLYSLKNIEPGTYTVEFSFVGYETLQVPNVEVVAGKVTEVNTGIGASAASLDEVIISTVSRQDSEVALLLEQKSAIQIKESIGAQELAKIGVSNAGTATTKIAGVTSSEASGDIFVRGLGDRYLYTTLNGLPIPSDDVDRKNIDLSLFSTRVIKSVGITKTYSPSYSADQASGNINIESRELVGSEELDLGIKVGVNTNAAGQFGNFKVSPNQENVYVGFHQQNIPIEYTLYNQSWDPQTAEFPINRRYALTAGKKFGDKLKMLLTASHSNEFEYRAGIFTEYRNNNRYDYFTDVESYTKTDNTTGLLDILYEFNDNHELKATSLFINKLTDEVYESGRNGEGVVFEETNPAEGLNQFVRDQNITQTRIWINQLHGTHNFFSNNELNWGVGYNLVNADEPNRIRNEVNFDGEEFIQLGRTGGYQQRKSSQKIEDHEINAYIEDRITFSNTIEEDSKMVFVDFGGSFRNKQRDFVSRFFGVIERPTNTFNPNSLDNLSTIFTIDNFRSENLEINELTPDFYQGELQSYGGFVNFNYGQDNWNVNLGARFQEDEINVDFRVNNYPANRPQFSNKSYSNIYPALNVKYSPGDNSNIRFSASRTITLPEFKEIAPFEYVSQTGQVTRGNPDLEASNNLNFDLKYEFFPTSGQLVSLTGFYKNIKDPINKVQDRGSAGVFSYFNAGEEANIYGLELETRLNVIDNESPEGLDLELAFNATRMWHKQGLKDVYEDGTFIRTFRYNNKSEIGLQGASDWIFNSSLNFSTESEDPFRASLVGNYASDKIYALGAPEAQTQENVFYNDEIIEKGFVTLDLVVSKSFGDHWDLQFQGENLLNPEIERVQDIRPSSTGIETTQTVRSYTRGAIFSLGVNYSF